ncbi:hypothetical protein K7X08_016643 [Anisodus acutangulus]|uniref:Uncharacterized protein n=1 Tax=Anisodus acutangulus TaxID=402998 RepID=A0A9Q1LE50_9SOLA|nr:hypothetical protein K7X08_016643 [Anisodus acutangulus]
MIRIALSPIRDALGTMQQRQNEHGDALVLLTGWVHKLEADRSGDVSSLRADIHSLKKEVESLKTAEIDDLLEDDIEGPIHQPVVDTTPPATETILPPPPQSKPVMGNTKTLVLVPQSQGTDAPVEATSVCQTQEGA